MAQQEEELEFEEGMMTSSDDPFELLSEQHREVEAIFDELENTSPRAKKARQDLAARLAEKLDLPFVDVRLAGHVPTYYEFDLSKGRRLLGYAPSYDIVRMIDEGLDMRAGQAVGVVPTHVSKA